MLLTYETVKNKNSVKKEKADLDARIERIQSYLRYQALPHEWMRLQRQVSIMEAYSNILEERLIAWL